MDIKIGAFQSRFGSTNGTDIFLWIHESLIKEDQVNSIFFLKDGKSEHHSINLFLLVNDILEHEMLHIVMEELEGSRVSTLFDFSTFAFERVRENSHLGEQ